jgi:xylulokinase
MGLAVAPAHRPQRSPGSALAGADRSRPGRGTILPAIAERLGINPNAIVASGGGDNMMGAIGTGNIAPA